MKKAKDIYDMSAQLVNSNLGHGNKAIVNAIKDQAEKIPFIGPGFAIDVRSDAAEAIVEASGLEGAKEDPSPTLVRNPMKTPSKSQNSTPEDARSSRQYRCYHGSSAGAGMLTGEPRHFANEPGPAGFIKYDGPYAYRAPKACKFEN